MVQRAKRTMRWWMGYSALLLLIHATESSRQRTNIDFDDDTLDRMADAAFPVPMAEKSDEPTSFEGAMEADLRSRQTRGSGAQRGRAFPSWGANRFASSRSSGQAQNQDRIFGESTMNDGASKGGAAPKGGSKGGAAPPKKEELKIGCCKLCPEQFSGLDVIPVLPTFLETAELATPHFNRSPAFTKRHQPQAAAAVMHERLSAFATSPTHATWSKDSPRFVAARSKIKSSGSLYTSAQARESKGGAEAPKAGAAAKDSSKGGGGPKPLPPPPPPPAMPMTIEQLIAATPCCPVCLEQFDPPVDSDGGAAFIEIKAKYGDLKKGHQYHRHAPLDAFLELGEGARVKHRASSQAQVGVGKGGASAKGGAPKLTCCTMCPNEAIPSGGTYTAASFLEIAASARKGGSSKGGAAPEADKRIRADGCCNQCPASMFESAEIRFQEPQGGPFGLKPRLKSVSSAMPLVQPVVSKTTP